jgi:inorganic pyrophosphatase
VVLKPGEHAIVVTELEALGEFLGLFFEAAEQAAQFGAPESVLNGRRRSLVPWVEVPDKAQTGVSSRFYACNVAVRLQFRQRSKSACPHVSKVRRSRRRFADTPGPRGPLTSEARTIANNREHAGPPSMFALLKRPVNRPLFFLRGPTPASTPLPTEHCMRPGRIRTANESAPERPQSRLHHVPHRHADSGRILVLIETPAGSQNKYKFDTSLQALRVSRVLSAGLIFPHDFGSIPGTCADDGDALDALVVGLPPTFPGCFVTTRLLGAIWTRQSEQGRLVRNDRLIACVETDATPAAYRSLRQLGEDRLRVIEFFFDAYNRAQGRTFEIIGRGTASDAYAAVARGAQRYRRRKD